MARHESAAPAVQVRELTKTYPGGVEAVKAIDFEMAAGEVFGLLGPNGAGKSTTIGMLTTTIAPTSGTAALAGYDVRRHPLRARSVSSVVFQEPVVDRGLTGRANLELHANLWGVAAGARVDELAGTLGVADSWIGRWGPTAADSFGGWKSHARSFLVRACCSSTSRRWAWTRASASSCWTRSPGCAGARR
jgi:ABC-type transport system involved in cytochrome bd biosynthesis fused ATPase/permease subunit